MPVASGAGVPRKGRLRLRGSEGSNVAPSSGESATNRVLQARLECRRCRRQARSSRHGFPLISIEQNNLSRAPGCRGSLQLVDIYRTVDFEDALRREASKPVRWLPSVCRQFSAGECLGRHAPLFRGTRPMTSGHRCAFKARFRAHAYGWRGSSLASTRLKEAVRNRFTEPPVDRSG